MDLKFIAILPPAFDHRRSVLRRQKTSGVEVLIPQVAIERLDKTVSLRLAGYVEPCHSEVARSWGLMLAVHGRHGEILPVATTCN